MLCSQPLYFGKGSKVKLKDDTYNTHSIIPKDDKDRQRFSTIFATMRKENIFKAEQLELKGK